MGNSRLWQPGEGFYSIDPNKNSWSRTRSKWTSCADSRRNIPKQANAKCNLHPSLVGKTAIIRQAVLLALAHSSPAPSQDSCPSGISSGLLPITVAGPRRYCTGLPY